MSTRRSEEPNVAEAIEAHLLAKASDAAFKAAMRREIRLRNENPHIGVDHRPSTKNPRFVGMQSLPVIRSTSMEDE